VAALPSKDNVGPWVSKDGLRIYFTEENGGDKDILMAERQTRDDAFGAVRAVFVGPEYDAWPTLSEDELTIAFESKRAGGSGRTDIWMATRSTTSESFGRPFVIDGLNSPEYDFDPAFSANANVLYFASEREHRGDPDIYFVTRKCLE